MSERLSVSRIIEGLKEGDPEAVDQLWVRYFDRLVAAARRKLGAAPKRTYDEEDVALSVFKSLCRGAERGNFAQLTDRQDLWALLLALTRQKAVNRIRHETRKKRGGGGVRGESVFARHQPGAAELGLDRLMADEPSPDFLVLLEEQHDWLLGQLADDTQRQVAVMYMEGHSAREIAERFGFTTRWAELKLEIIRKQWGRVLEKELGD